MIKISLAIVYYNFTFILVFHDLMYLFRKLKKKKKLVISIWI